MRHFRRMETEMNTQAYPLHQVSRLQSMMRRFVTAPSGIVIISIFLTSPVPSALGTPTWTKVTNLAPGSAGLMLLLTDGTIMVQNGASQNWMRLTPNAQGSYINGVWTLNPIAPMSTPRLYYASHVLPDGRVWVLGGEYTGPGLVANRSATAEIYNPITNTWSAAATYPNTPGCPPVSSFGGFVIAGSSVVTGILSTEGWQPGWNVSGTGIPAGTLIASIDSPSQIHLSQNANLTLASALSLTATSTGNTTSGTNIVSGLPSTTGLQIGFGITGAGIQAGTTVTSFDSPTQIRISRVATATASGVALTFGVTIRPPACFGDTPSMLLPSGKILAGNIVNNLTYLYDVATDSWAAGRTKIYNDQSSEETWARMGDGTILNYDIFQSNSAGTGYAERYNPATNTWSSISPAVGTASGTLPLLSSASIGFELGGILRLYDGRMFVIGATGHTALYDPALNSWAAGPDLIGSLGGAPFLFSADDAPAAILPNGHVILAADAGLGLPTTGNTSSGSTIVTGIPSTAQIQTGWAVSGTGIPSGVTVSSVDSGTQVHISMAATAGNTGVALKFGATFSKPTMLLDYDPVLGTIFPVSPVIPDPNLNNIPSYVTRMLMLPTGELLFSDSTNQLWVYTPDGAAAPSLRPMVAAVTNNGAGLFTLSGTQLTGQSSGSSYGDDAESDEDYPVIRLVNAAGTVYRARTTNWSPIGVGTGSTPQTVDFTLDPATPNGPFSLIVSAAGISSDAFPISIGPDLSVSKSHFGSFIQGQTTASYSIEVSNVGTQATTGTVTVRDIVPWAFTPISISGTNWTCTQPAGPCTQNAPLLSGDSYPLITITVSVSLTAPSSVTNLTLVLGGGDVNFANNASYDVTTIDPATIFPLDVASEEDDHD